MKKFLKISGFIFLALIVLGVFASMGTDESTPSPQPTEVATAPEETTEATTEATEPTEEPTKVQGISEPLKVGDIVYTVNSREEATNVGGDFGQNSKGKYLILDVTVKNEGKEALLVDTSLFTLVNGDTTYEADGTASIYANEQSDFFLTEINPELEMTGKVVFDISEEAHTKDLLLNVKTGFFGTEQGQIALQ